MLGKSKVNAMVGKQLKEGGLGKKKPADIHKVRGMGKVVRGLTKAQQRHFKLGVRNWQGRIRSHDAFTQAQWDESINEEIERQKGTAQLANRDYMMGKIKDKGGMYLAGALGDLNDDLEVVMEAVKNNGLALEHAHENLKTMKTVVMEAVKNNGLALEHASSTMQDNPEVVRAAVQNNGLALRYASLKVQDHLDVVMDAIRQNGMALEHASWKMRNNPVVVRAAIEQNMMALDHASPDVRDKILTEAKNT